MLQLVSLLCCEQWEHPLPHLHVPLGFALGTVLFLVDIFPQTLTVTAGDFLFQFSDSPRNRLSNYLTLKSFLLFYWNTTTPATKNKETPTSLTISVKIQPRKLACPGPWPAQKQGQLRAFHPGAGAGGRGRQRRAPGGGDMLGVAYYRQAPREKKAAVTQHMQEPSNHILTCSKKKKKKEISILSSQNSTHIPQWQYGIIKRHFFFLQMYYKFKPEKSHLH